MKDINTAKLVTLQKVVTSPIVVLFYRQSCYLCHDLMPVYEMVGNTLKNTLTKYYDFYKIDADANKEITKKFSDSGVPTILLFMNNLFTEIPYPKDGYTEQYLAEFLIAFDVEKEFGENNESIL